MVWTKVLKSTVGIWRKTIYPPLTQMTSSVPCPLLPPTPFFRWPRQQLCACLKPLFLFLLRVNHSCFHNILLTMVPPRCSLTQQDIAVWSLEVFSDWQVIIHFSNNARYTNESILFLQEVHSRDLYNNSDRKNEIFINLLKEHRIYFCKDMYKLSNAIYLVEYG